MPVKLCEYPELPCRARAAWLVTVGSRKADRQLSCGRHLNQACLALASAELPRTALLTVTSVIP